MLFSTMASPVYIPANSVKRVKNGTDEPVWKAGRGQIYGHQGRRGESEMNWETEIGIYTLLCIKQITNENLPDSTESSTQYSAVT